MMGWHFAGQTLRDGRPLPKAGERLEHTGPLVPCESGLHFSVRAIDALTYAPGAMVALVEAPDDAIAHNGDKHVASWRVAVSGYADATRVLHEFACWCATHALDREYAAGRKVDPRSRSAVAVKLAWLDGKATDNELAAAWDAAWDAARAAAWDAAGDAQSVELERRLTELLTKEAARV